MQFLRSNFSQILLLAGLLYFIPAGKAQNFVSEANRWNVYATGYPSYIATETYIIEGDSSFNGKIYKKIWQTYDSVDVIWSYKGLLREDSNRVFYIPPGGTEGILYDFNAEPGDTVMIINMFCYEPVSVIISAIDTVEYMGVKRKRWFLGDNWSSDFWIDGIGGSLGPLHSAYYLCIVCPTWDLLCYHRNDTLLYMKDGLNKCYYSSVGVDEGNGLKKYNLYPNPATEIVHIQHQQEIDRIEIRELNGRLVLEQVLPPGRKETQMNLSELEPGVYFCILCDKENNLTQKLIIQ